MAEGNPLGAWSNFYIMTGSAAAGLTGLMFVVITLVTGVERRRTRDGISMFSTPTVLHFAAALLVSATLSAPWPSLVQPAIILALAGLYGTIYILRVAYRARLRQVQYQPDLEDWIWYTVLPLIGYLTTLGAALELVRATDGALFALAGGVVLLIFIGIRNAWDIVTFIAIGGTADSPNPPPVSGPDA